jgi:nucleoside-diphosphate-sugar epimerase
VAAATRPGARDETFNLCTGVETKVREVAAALVEIVGGRSRLLLEAKPYRKTELFSLSGSPARAEAALGWRAATPLSQGLRKTVDWLRAHQARYPEYMRDEDKHGDERLRLVDS